MLRAVVDMNKFFSNLSIIYRPISYIIHGPFLPSPGIN